MRSTSTRVRVLSAAVSTLTTATLVVAAAAAPAQAGRRDVRTSGTCSAGAVWKLKVKTDDGALQWEAEVDSNRRGQVWRVRVRDDGDLVFAGSRRTAGPSGSFSVERRTADRAGDDRFVLRARHRATGQVCRGSLTF